MKTKDPDIIPFPPLNRPFPNAPSKRGYTRQGNQTLIDGVPAAELVKSMVASGLASYHQPERQEAPPKKHRDEIDQLAYREILKRRQRDCMQRQRAVEKGLTNEPLFFRMAELARDLTSQRDAAKRIYRERLDNSNQSE